ncbi:MAG: hypothetical protein LC104_09465 [Bacteroidales bacterium]|nr:hypothetical protein [Bacteroidales bacterium]
MTELTKRIRTLPPRCIGTAWPSPASIPDSALRESDDIPVACWSVRAHATNDHSSVLGKPYAVASVLNGTVLLGAIAISSGTEILEIFDPSVHGFNNEIDVIDCGMKKASMPPNDLNDRLPFHCDRCQGVVFTVKIMTYFQPGTVVILLTHDDLPTSDMFNAFNVFGTCLACGMNNIIAEADGL